MQRLFPIQAMATGCPVVSTDCPHGPAEILEHGKYDPLVPVGDAAALAEAMRRTLDAPPDADALRDPRGGFHVERAIDAYEALLCRRPRRAMMRRSVAEEERC